MESVLIVGLETLVGSNLAATLVGQAPVTGVPLGGREVSITGVRAPRGPSRTPAEIHDLVQQVRPGRLVYCGAAAHSCWDAAFTPSMAEVAQARTWCTAAEAVDAHVTMISSDGVFTGPWMFHPETGHSLCPSDAAQAIRAVEQQAIEAQPQSLILRTHVFGWSAANSPGLVERWRHQLEVGEVPSIDAVRHASPMLVTEFIKILTASWQAGLNGVYHVGGAERVNPASFLIALANEFQLPLPRLEKTTSLTNRATGFGCGETSLQTRKIRRALGIGLPLLRDGMRQMHRQEIEGWRQALGVAGPRVSRVA